MKRIFWASTLLALAVLLMPLLFVSEEQAAALEDYVPPVPSHTPEPTPEPYKPSKDEQTAFTALLDGAPCEMTMAEYLPQVLAAEMPAVFHGEALKAQAVAARTYILYCMQHENAKHPDADVCGDSGCCLACLSEDELRAAWGASFEANREIIAAAVSETDGQVLTYNEEPVLAAFHSSSAGSTEDGSELWGQVPYLVCVKSPETGRDVPDYVTTVEVSAGDMRESVLLLKPEAVFSDDPSAWLGSAELDGSGRVRTMQISGESLTGQELRSLFALRSTAFTLEYAEGRFLFTVTGYGHGLGMSQYGANVMAKGGFAYEEILAHYYPETALRQ